MTASCTIRITVGLIHPPHRGSSRQGHSSREDFSRHHSPVTMRRRLLITAFAFGLLLLALGGWLVQVARLTPRLLAASAS
jgi:hypothetical protein